MRSKNWGLLVSVFVVAGGLGVVFAQVSQDEPVGKEGAIVVAAAEPLDIGVVVPMPANTVFRTYVSGVGEVSGSGSAASTFGGSIVYSNRLGNGIYSPGGVAGALVGDDFATLVSPGCILDNLRFRVSGDPLGDGSGVGGYSVQFAFYSGCPSAGGFPVFTPITEVFPDNGNYEVVFKPDLATEITIPTNGYFGVKFSRSLAGIISGALPTAGFSADLFDFPQARCDANFGGFPGFDHGSFDLEITSRNDCPDGVCSSTCSGGDNVGEFCFQDDCPLATCVPDVACLGGTNNAGPCTTDSDCPSVCSSGANPGDPCTSDNNCANACRSGTNAGGICTTDEDCPGSDCLIGVCPVASCSRDQCDGGLNNGALCSVDDCPNGSCDGPSMCDGGTNADQACVFGCVASFPAYKNTSQGGQSFTSRPTDDFFADEIILSFPAGLDNPCRLISWEVGFKGQINGTGAVQAELHTFLDIDDPENGGRIPGTRVADQISGDTVKIFKKTFSTPILITQENLFVVFKTSNDLVGAIRTCKEAGPGTVRDAYLVHSGDEGATWQVRGFEAGCVAAFEVTLSCQGSPAIGACCDMTLTDDRVCIGGTRDGQTCNRDSQCRVCIGGSKDGFRCDQNTDCPGGFCPPEGTAFCVGDAVCRTLPEMNCAHFLWREGEACGAHCDGGASDGQACTTMFDCPPACVGGGRDGGDCFSNSDCPGVCEESSAFAGNSCSTDAECRRNAQDTSECIDHGTCTDNGVCRGQFCVGGLNSGAPCSRSIDCPDSPTEEGECGSSCMGGDNDGLPCLRTADCPLGSCPATPFPEPCGLGTCCTSNDLRCCVTQEECHTAGTECGLAGTPLETPVQYRVGQDCAAGGCPRGACLGQEGDCTQERAGLCVGGTLNGTECFFNDPCFIDPCCQNGGLCEGQPGCESPTCCTEVCDQFLNCCSIHWSQTCANASFELPNCRRVPANDTCSDPSPVKGAMFLALNDSVEVDLSNATGDSQPGLCCFRQESNGPGPGSQAEATVWIKTIAPAEGTCRGGLDNNDACTQDLDCDLSVQGDADGSIKCRANFSVDTCNTTGGGGDDSIIQIFSVGNLDAGLCEDESICSVEFQNCVDGFACEFDEEAYCHSLSPIGCNDDAPGVGLCRNSGGTPFPFNSDVCVDAIPGDPYYIMVAAKDNDARGKYRVRTSSFCSIDPPPLFNDACADAEPLGIGGFGCDPAGNCDAFFDLSGNLDNAAAATFDCPGPGCLNTMELDVWYDWTAPATGRVSGDTCDGGNTPDTSLVLYNGCDCPADFGNELSCSETVLSGDCFLGSRVSAAVTGGQCYKFRLGGNFIGTPSGNLDINFVECPPGPIDPFDPLNDPPLQTIDGRAPLDPFTNQARGIDSFTVKWVGGTTDKACYSYCETFVDGFAANDVFIITDNGDDTFTVNLARPLAPGATGTLTMRHGDNSTSQLFALSLPGDANGDGSATSPADLDFLVAALNGAGSFDKYRHDMDHSGTLTPADLLRWIDVTSGVPGAFEPWLNFPFPDCAPCCPN